MPSVPGRHWPLWRWDVITRKPYILSPLNFSSLIFRLAERRRGSTLGYAGLNTAKGVERAQGVVEHKTLQKSVISESLVGS